jgi:hypothetical protein
MSPTGSTTPTLAYLPVGAFVPLGEPGCHPTSPLRQSPAGTEALATATGGQVWALLFSGLPFPIHQPVKIVWRITNSSTLALSGTGPGGASARLSFFVPHGASNWERPGLEWGSGFVLPTAGCWDLHARGGPVTAG